MFGAIAEFIRCAQSNIRRRPYVSLIIFVTLVVLTSTAGYARYQHLQAELEAQRDIRYRLQQGISDWRDDLSIRLGDLKDGIQATAQGATGIVSGTWGIIRYLVGAVFDFIGNLYIMVPVTVIYFCVGFFGTLKMRLATLLGALIAFWISTSIGIVPGSVIGLLAMAGLLGWDKLDPRLLTAIQGLPATLKDRLQKTQHPSVSQDGTETTGKPRSDLT